MSCLEALILGVVQGLTEYLPVSSSGHLQIGHALLGTAGEENLTFAIVVHAATVLSTLVVLWRGIQIARQAQDSFGTLLAVGITSMLAFHVLVNVGMTAGIMPVTGIPLPFMSYGVSALTTNIWAITILMNIYLRNQKLQF